MAIVADLVAQLKRGGPFKDPFRRAYPSIPPYIYVEIEVQRAIERLRKIHPPFERQPDVIAESRRSIHHAKRALRPDVIDDDLRLWANPPAGAWQEPPPKADVLRHHCAAEMFDLLCWFSPKPPTKYEGGPFRIGASLLYEIVTGEPGADLKRDCVRILRLRKGRRYQHQF